MQSEKKEFLSRTELLLGEDGIDRLRNARIIIFGVGGVGGYALEALVRSGVERIALVDADTVSVSNINRQIIATVNTVGMPKVEAARDRALSINPDAEITLFPIFYEEKNEKEIDLSSYDYVIDAIDTVTSKLRLIENAGSAGVPIISSMGAGNKLDPTAFKVADIYKTSVCPLARVIRTELKRRGIKRLKCVYSEELPAKAVANDESTPKTRHAPASLATIPSVVGLIIANEVIKDISNINKN
ncbi:MAG: tRNA threonylcarbamoyladenosine dehydratase [Clostridia bacterium]|nr:tRNA threonylcarbamoyladenosine dehydratase [Clostridia bacterium]